MTNVRLAVARAKHSRAVKSYHAADTDTVRVALENLASARRELDAATRVETAIEQALSAYCAAAGGAQ